MRKDRLYWGTENYGEKFLEFCQPIKQFLEIDNESYYNVNLDGNMINIHSNDKWIEGYIAGEHYLDDPHMVHPNNMHSGFCILMVNDTYKYQQYNDVLLYDRQNTPMFGYGFTYIVKTNFDFSAFCFTTNKNNYIINKIINENKLIELFVQKLDEQIKSLLENIKELKISLPQLKGERFLNQKGIVFTN